MRIFTMCRRPERPDVPASVLLVLLVLCLVAPQEASGRSAIKPSGKDKCPVCGMFVAKFPDWTAVVLFKDGSRAFFDGAKDMFKYLLDPRRYDPSKRPSGVEDVGVVDYYSLKTIDGREAFYVVGSDVYGPMGRELIPFGKKSDAGEFLKDHRGKRIVRFDEVTQSLVKELDS